MSLFPPRISRPELFFGFVAPIGAPIDPILSIYRNYLTSQGYKVIDVKITSIFKAMAPYVAPIEPLANSPLSARYRSYIKYGNQLRKHFEDNSILAASAIGRIVRKRNRLKSESKETESNSNFSRVAYLIHQFKRKEEVDLFRSVYGKLFFQVSVYSRRGARVDWLARRFASSSNANRPEKYRSDAESIIQIDEEEIGELHGQRVAKIFHDADFIVSADSIEPNNSAQVTRFCNLLFSSNSVSPTRMEYGMFAAKAAALRTLDLSRQVGAAIFTADGEVLSQGSNEVPKGSGGTYWPDDEFDARDYSLEKDSNHKRKEQLLAEILTLLDAEGSVDEKLAEKLQSSQFMDALEYGRVVHAEMSAICDAARLGRALKGSTLFCTTFPCHMCAKHIVASGVSRVVFLEPYPKSLANELHSDALEIEGSDRGQYDKYPAVKFEHFYGITPRRYRELFERGARKDEKGNFKPFIGEQPLPLIDIKVPHYTAFEEMILDGLRKIVKHDEVFADDSD